MRLLGCTAAAIVVTSGAGRANAACAPNPPRTNDTTICSERTDGGLVASTSTTVNVIAGATLAGNGANPALTVIGEPNYVGTLVRLNVGGVVDGNGSAGLLASAPNSNLQLNINVAAGGTIQGSSAIDLQGNGGFATVFTIIDNAGSIRAGTGTAIVSPGASPAYIASINNRAGGFIGGIDASVSSLNNGGTIDGGNGSAYRTGLSSSVVNSGSIVSAGAAETLVVPVAFSTIVNSGRIMNAGAGTAIAAAPGLSLTNQAGATIASGGAAAIRSDAALTFVNRGEVTGSVIAGGAADSRVDTVGGAIRGDVLFGEGDDRLIGTLDGSSGRFAEIAGAVDGGGGINTAEFIVASDMALSTIMAPVNFQQVQFDLRDGATVTSTGSVDLTLTLAGAGTFVNAGSVTTNGPAINSGYIATQDLNFINLGSISATLAQPDGYAVELRFASTFLNENTIAAFGGNGVRVDGNYREEPLTNNGTIVATGTAFTASSGPVANNGTIRSTAGTGARITLGGGTIRTVVSNNSGLIEGATIGAATDAIILVNTGTINATNGIGVDPGSYSTIDNRAGGVISGTVAAIGFANGYGFAAYVRNAGAIVGDVNFAVDPRYSGSTGSIYIDEGGTIDGNLRLGSGLLITDAGRFDDGRFTGATGVVDPGTNGGLRLRVGADTSLAVDGYGGFATVGLELSNDAALTLTASRTLNSTLELTGRGSVDLTADITTVDRQVIDLYALTTEEYLDGEIYPGSEVSVVSRGALSFTSTNGLGGYPAVFLAPASTFENAGTLSVTADPGERSGATGIAGNYPYAGTAINSGTITLAGLAAGISGVRDVTNTGRIIQASGDTGASVGVGGYGTLRNSGLIETAGAAVSSGYSGLSSDVVNSGRIASTGAAAIENLSYYGAFRIENQAGGTISGGMGVAIRSGAGTTLVNAGRIVGDVRLNEGQSFLPQGAVYIAAGGTIEGSLLFGDRDDVLVSRGATAGVTGMIDAGGGLDRYVRSFDSNATVTPGAMLPTSFEAEGFEVRGRDTAVTLSAVSGGVGGPVALYGNGSVVNMADVPAGTVDSPNLITLELPFEQADAGALAFTNQARIADGVTGVARSFINSGTIGTVNIPGAVVDLAARGGELFTFANSGTIQALGNSGYSPSDYSAYYYDVPAVDLHGENSFLELEPQLAATVGNSGTIDGGLRANLAAPIAFENSGTISRDAEVSATVALASGTYAPTGAAPLLVTASNTGTIAAAGRGGAGLTAIAYAAIDPTVATSIDIVNSGTIATYAAGELLPGNSALLFVPSTGIGVVSNRGDVTLVNQATGVITASSGGIAVAVGNPDGTFTLDNAGTISGPASLTVPDPFRVLLASSIILPNGSLGGAVEIFGAASTVRNSGAITGSIMLDELADRIENSGTITGNVFLGGGDDTFLQRASGRVIGQVDGGIGTDALIVDATGGGAINADQFVNFESFAQTGVGNVTYMGDFNYDTIRLNGGTITVDAGAVLRSNGPVTITGGDGSEAVINNGTIAGPVALGGGADSYTEGPGSSVGAVDGGGGTDTYMVALTGDRSGIGARSGFERLAVTGTGTLSLTLDQSFEAIGLSGTGIDLRLAGFAPGGIDGSDGAESVTLDGDVARVSLGAGNDALRVAGTTLTGSYEGGGGTDSLTLTSAGPVTLTGTATGFEAVTLTGGALTVTGTLGAAGGTATFGDGAQVLTIASGGRLLGSVDLGAGADSFRLAAGGQLLGTVSGGAGTDGATLDLTADLALGSDTLRDFETLTTTGTRTLTLTGVARFDRIDASGGLTVAANASLAAPQVQFGSGNDRFVVAGSFAGSADGGAGTDALELSGGGAEAPVAFQTISGFESLAMTGGVATIAGTAQFGRIDMTGGRLIGLAGSTITAPTIAVGSGATFGSAGNVTGNLAVAGTLSPGASPGTMSVTGNVALAAGSTTLLEFTPTVSDKLVISGTLSIASGATLTLTGARPLTPGAALDLIVASGGISGSYTTVNQPATILGFIRQAADRIQLFGQFAAAGFDPQVSATIGYVNNVLTGGQASAALIAAVPSLLTTGNATNAAAFARLNPEAYASATQISIQNGLTLAKAARSNAAAGRGDAAGAFTFVQGLGDWRPLDGNAALGTSRARTHSYGLLGGVGFGTEKASIGGFVGYLDSRQRIAALDARTDSDGIVAGLIGHVAAGGFEASALLAYDGGKADTRRALPGSATAASRYSLHGWVSDTSVGYALPLAADWALKPEAGLTYVDTRRGAATETGGGAFALDVARRRSHATFVDGALTLSGGQASGATIRPWVSAGVRHQLNGRATLATAGFLGSTTSFSVLGVDRSATLATAGAGVSVDLSPGLDLFAAYRGEFGKDGTGTNLNGGLRLRF